MTPPTIKLLTVLLFLVVLAGGLLWLKGNNANDKAQRPPSVCSDDVLKRARGLLTAQKADKLSSVVDEISALKDYERDPNCLYVVTTYYVNVSDPENARLYFDKLDKIYQADAMKPVIYDSTTLHIDALKNTVNVLEEVSNKNRQQNVPSVEGPAGE